MNTSTIKVKHFYDKDTYTLTYVVYDELTKDAVVIDPVWDYDAASGKISESSVEKVAAFINENQLKPILSLETHPHADHLSGYEALKRRYPNLKSGVSDQIQLVQREFSGTFNIDIPHNGEQFDFLYKDGEVVQAGSLSFKVINTPGHTPACSSLLFEDMLFTGDSMFMPDYGTGRCDFPMGSASDLYSSITKKIFTLPDDTKIFVGHDYQPDGRSLEFQTTVKDQKKHNIQLNENTTEKEFVEMRENRDKTLNAPKLLIPSIQVNIDGGKLPKVEDNGVSYLKIPLKITSLK